MTGPFSARREIWHRLFNVACAALGLAILSPVLSLLALCIWLCDGRPVMFSQMRVGRYGREFRIWKFRTMRSGAIGCAVTAAGDPRITALGARLRRFKLDELPQLLNVLRGDMNLVGPRPEAPQYVNRESPVWQAILSVRPGLTDLATLLHRDEEALLGSSVDAAGFYRRSVLPAKLQLSLQYQRTRSFVRDLKLIWLTIRYSLAPEQFDRESIRKTFGTGAEHVGYTYSLSPAVDR